MDVLKLIEKDHREVKKVIKRLEAQAEKNTNETAALVQELTLLMKVHAKVEEKLIYKACLAADNEKLNDFALEGNIEHKLVEVTLAKLAKTKPGDDGKFKALLTVVKELVEHHAEEEEEEDMFPKFRRAYKDAEREEMGEQYLMLKEKMQARFAATIGRSTPRRVSGNGARKPSLDRSQAVTH